MPRYRLVSRESTYAKRDRADGAARTKRNDAAAPTSYEPPYSYTRIGRGIPGAAPQRDYGQRSRGNTGAPTPFLLE